MFMRVNFIYRMLFFIQIYGYFTQNDVAALCGYEHCVIPDPNLINVHLVPHTHDDVGWLKTIEQYFYGTAREIQRASVRDILDSVITELLKNPNRKFIYVESIYFFKWWHLQNNATRDNVRKLIANGQLEFIGGGWSMNDEATTHYQSIIDQMTIGLKAITDTFGICARPRVGWQVDTFGHSREMASIFAQMGYDGLILSRYDWVEKVTRITRRNAELIWQASATLGDSAEIFTSFLYDSYNSPEGFCFDENCDDDPIVDDDTVENNVNQTIDTFLNYMDDWSIGYRTNNFIVPMGGDFNYGNAKKNFDNLDKLIKYVNQRQATGSKINLFYSTPSCYFHALHQQQNIEWQVKTEDFLPYSTDGFTFWTGFYTSRPTLKRFERIGNHFLQITKQLTVLANLSGKIVKQNLKQLREVMGALQHHDAITGTEKQHVADDYAHLLTKALKSAHYNVVLALRKMTNLTDGEFLNENKLLRRKNKFIVTLYNPLFQQTTQYVRVPVKKGLYTIAADDGQLVPYQLVPIAKPMRKFYNQINGVQTQYELVFMVNASKIVNYFVSKATTKIEAQMARFTAYLKAEKDMETIVENSQIKLVFDANGHLKMVEMNNDTQFIRQDFFYYKSACGDNLLIGNRSSGAYIFRPNGSEILIGENVRLKIVSGDLVKEVHQIFNDYVSQVIRIYENTMRIEFEWLIGPIPDGTEIITRFTTNLATKGVFSTDSNGREILQRLRDEREQFDVISEFEPVSSNYYPITTRMSIEDEHTRIVVMTDRAQGGSSIRDGEMEIMLHRRLLMDDAFGVGETLNETDTNGAGVKASGKLYLYIDSVKNHATINDRNIQQEILLPLCAFYSSTSTDMLPTNILNYEMSGLLPDNIHVLTLELFNDKEILLRLENLLQINEMKPIKFNLRKFFDVLHGQKIWETTLDGNMQLNEMKRMKFSTFNANDTTSKRFYTANHKSLTAKANDDDDKFYVSFQSMEIRTFIVKVT